MKLIKKYKQEIMYLIFGGVVTLVNWIIYSVLVVFLSVGVTTANAGAWVIAVIVAFITNKIYVFESRRMGFKEISKEIISFFLSRVSTGLLDVFLPTVLIAVGISGSLFAIDGFYAKLIANVVVIILNYILSKKFVFK
jgi:putative flippase GtrA